MNPERYRRVVELFHQACEMEQPLRAEFLAKACGPDEEVRRAVESMLAADAESGILERPPEDLAAGVLRSPLRNPGASPQDTDLEKLPAGTILGPYRIEGELGTGGMGRVYEAVDTRLERKVAIKVSPQAFSDRFEREALAIAALNHPHICTLYDVGPNYLVMELIRGRTLADRIREGPLPLGEALDIAGQVADALDAAHQNHVVHRDLKPGNIMVREDGIVKVLDFGIAKTTSGSLRGDGLTSPGMIVGTIRYMSPEQARGEPVNAQTDLYSLGVVLYEMIAGRPPFSGATASDTMAEILKSEPPSLAQYLPGVPADLERIVARALRKDKTGRYPSAAEVKADLKALQRSLESGVALSVAPALARRKPIARRRLAVAAGSVLLAAIAAISWMFTNRSGGSGQVQSLAVLPFVNASNNSEAEYIGDGISENLINTLSQLPQLKVIARASAFRYKGGDVDAAEIGKALAVRFIVMGRVIEHGPDLAINAELVDTRDKAQLWGQRYDRTTDDLQVVQTDIARKVSEKLGLRTSSAQERQIAKRGTENAEAYRLYLQGLYFGQNHSVPGLKKKLDYCQRAVALDPNFASAYAELGATYDALSGLVLAPAEGMSRAKEALQKALTLDPALAQAHEMSARIKSHDWDWVGAEADFQRAMELNPGDALTHGNYANFLLLSGRVKEALSQIRRAQELDPLSVRFQFSEGTALYQARSYEEAIQLFQRIIQAQPDHWRSYVYLGYAYEASGKYGDAIAALQKADALNETLVTSNQCFIGYSYALWGKRTAALKILEQLKSTKEPVSPGELAVLYLGLGDKEASLAALEQAYAAHDPQMANLISDPHYDGLRTEPRFRDLVKRVGLSF